MANGSHQQNYDYCTKGGRFFEWGINPTSTDPDDDGGGYGSRGAKYGASGGRREQERWDGIRNAVAEGRWEDVPSRIILTHYRTLKCYNLDHKPVPNALDAPCGIWLYGPAGVGKSTEARTRARSAFPSTEPGPGFYGKEAAHKWWDGYRDEPSVIIEDVDQSHGHLKHYLKIWADKWPFQAEVKLGSTGWIRPKLVIVTSQYRIGEFSGADASVTNALSRRFQQIQVQHWRERLGSGGGGVGDGLGSGGPNHSGVDWPGWNPEVIDITPISPGSLSEGGRSNLAHCGTYTKEDLESLQDEFLGYGL